MNYWLVKSEPAAYSYDDLIAEKKTMWEGVRNYGARNNMRKMKEGDLVLFYHSRQGLEVVAVTKVVKEFYPDPTAEKGDWSVVDIVPHQLLEKPVPLKVIKNTPELAEMQIVRNSRLSVMPVEKAEFMKILELGETELKA
jgi:predicted RNA-binding protein with PUA-like domain